MARHIITTLHPVNDENTNLYPNIKKDNIPDESISIDKFEEWIQQLINNIPTLQKQIEGVSSGSPKGVYATVAALTSAFPNGDEGIYVVEADDCWYYWNGIAWTNGGTYYDSTAFIGLEIGGTPSSPYNNANTYPYNKIYRIDSPQNISNLPVSSGYGSLWGFTFEPNNTDVAVQFYADSSTSNFYFRTKLLNNYSAWHNIGLDTASVLHSAGFINDAVYPDLKLLPNNTIFYCADTETGISDLPENEYGKNGLIVTFNYSGSDTNAGKIQLFAFEDGNMYFRVNVHNDWFGWFHITTGQAVEESSQSLFGAFRSFGVIGDSLSVGCMSASGVSETDRALYYSWGQYLARKLNNNCVNLGQSGVTCEGWCNPLNQYCLGYFNGDAKQCQCYIIGLGVNDSNLGLTIGSTSDIDLVDYHNNANTFYGNYAKIIQIIQEKYPSSKIICLTMAYPYGSMEGREAYNVAIRNIVSLFSNTSLLDLKAHDDLFNSSDINSTFINGHYVALGYKKVAEIMDVLLTDLINNNQSDFLNIYAIPDEFGD